MKRPYYGRLVFVLLALSIFLGTCSTAFALPQDAKGHWAESNIQKYMDDEIITGYNDGSFKPDNGITRAEFITIMNRYFNLDATTEITFTDVTENSWHKIQIQKAVKEGFIVGYNDNTFRPNEFVERQEAAVMVAKLLKLWISEEGNARAQFIDGKDIPLWSLGSINSIIRIGLLKGYPDNTMRYQRNLTRAEALSLLSNMSNAIDKELTTIKSIALTNGTAKVSFDKSIDGLTIDDFEITAKLDGVNLTLKNLKFNSTNKTFTFDSVEKTNSVQTLAVTIAAGSPKTSGSASDTIDIARKSSTGSYSGNTENTAPSIPVITRTPSGNVSSVDTVTISAISVDAEGDAIEYIWNGKLADGSTYPIGKNVVTVKARDARGLESPQAAIVFFVIDSSSGSGGVLLTSPNSRIYESGIDGASITSFTFNVPSVSGHSGSDQAWVRGLNVNTQEWEYIPNVSGTTLGNPISGNPISISNGIYLEGQLTPGTYSRLEFFYYASHCMYGNSNITYTVDYSFGDIPAGTPAESAPVASNVTTSGLATVGSTLNGDYAYTDANGDLEGYVDSQYNVISSSLYQWYRADDASGTNKSAISGANSDTYSLTSNDAGKYLTFEVTPLAVTGVTGTLSGVPVESSAVYIQNDATDITSFTIPGQTSAAAIINSTDHTISIEVLSGTSVTALAPTIALSQGATVLPVSLSAQDFTSPVVYTVTAEDGITTQNWVVTVTIEVI